MIVANFKLDIFDAFAKLISKVLALLLISNIIFVNEMRDFNYKKAVQALNLLAQWSGGALNKMKALKLIWLADRFHLRRYGRPILQYYYVAMENGPVASATRDILQHNKLGVSEDVLKYAENFISENGSYDFKSLNDPNIKVFSKSDVECLKGVFDAYGHLGKYDLRDLTHKFPEWKRW
ncbi:MAG TPA: Panacea domain-containing protein, partial [Puia sp.]|nr:Panacea domain-containing protein [Puia sp.]